MNTVMKTILILLTAAFGLIMSAYAGPPAAPIQIPALPFNINAPGTYVLNGDLSFTDIINNQDTGLEWDYPAITISTAISGPVVLDLRGHTILGNVVLTPTYIPGGTGIAIGYALPGGVGPYIFGPSNTNSITIQNGHLKNLSVGINVWASNVSSNIQIRNVTFDNVYNSIVLSNTKLSTIADCVFSNTSFAIEDYGGKGGNQYINDTFKDSVANDITITGSAAAIKWVMFAAPSK